MATITYKSFLMYKTASASTFEKLVDIKDLPDGIIAEKEQVEVTTLSDGQHLYIPGLAGGASDGLPFTCNYDLDDWKKIEALEDEDLDIQVWFGGTDPVTAGGQAVPDGSLGMFGGKGKVTISLNSGGVNDVREMTVKVTPTSTWTRVESQSA